MADIKPHIPSLRFTAVFGQHADALDWACEKAQSEWGEILQQSPDFNFDMTSFYEKTMGDSLIKRLVAFRPLIDPFVLVQSKVDSNNWETDFAKNKSDSNPNKDATISRSLNIDPGYLTEAKVVLMTTKDRDHRLYMGSGIYGEVTLFYQLPGNWACSRWTYPDYKLDICHQFFHECRDYLRSALKTEGGVN